MDRESAESTVEPRPLTADGLLAKARQAVEEKQRMFAERQSPLSQITPESSMDQVLAAVKGTQRALEAMNDARTALVEIPIVAQQLEVVGVEPNSKTITDSLRQSVAANLALVGRVDLNTAEGARTMDAVKENLDCFGATLAFIDSVT